MEFNWLAISTKDSLITKDYGDDFISYNNCDLSFIPDNVKNIQFDILGGNSFIQKEEDGITFEEKISTIEEIPYISQIEELFEQKLTENTPPPPNEEELMEWLRFVRGQKLEEADIVILRAFEDGVSPPQAWVDYRQELRDVPQNVENGSLDMPVVTAEGDPYFPDYAISFNWPNTPS